MEKKIITKALIHSRNDTPQSPPLEAELVESPDCFAYRLNFPGDSIFYYWAPKFRTAREASENFDLTFGQTRFRLVGGWFEIVESEFEKDLDLPVDLDVPEPGVIDEPALDVRRWLHKARELTKSWASRIKLIGAKN